MSSRALACVLTLLAASALRAAPLAKAPSSLSSSSSSSSPSAAAALGHVEAPACSGTNVQLGAMSAGELFYIPCATSAMAGGGVWVHDVNVSNAQGAVLGVFNTDGPDCVNLESSYSSYSTSTSSAPAIVFTGAPCQNAPACCTVVRCNAVNGARGCPGVAASFAFYGTFSLPPRPAHLRTPLCSRRALKSALRGRPQDWLTCSPLQLQTPLCIWRAQPYVFHLARALRCPAIQCPCIRRTRHRLC